MQLTERHVITNNKEIDKLCFLSKNLYNYVNYILRQSFFKTSTLPREYDITKQLSKEKQADYIALPSQTSQQIIKLLYKNWKSFFKANKDFKSHPEKYKAKPKLPKFKHKTKGRNIIVFTNQQCRIK